jgi:hypothetical protein
MIALDKQAHFWAGAAISGLMVAYGIFPVVAFLVSSFVAGAKEVYDSLGYGTPDKWDFVVTVLGASTVLPLLIL